MLLVGSISTPRSASRSSVTPLPKWMGRVTICLGSTFWRCHVEDSGVVGRDAGIGIHSHTRVVGTVRSIAQVGADQIDGCPVALAAEQGFVAVIEDPVGDVDHPFLAFQPLGGFDVDARVGGLANPARCAAAR